MATLKSNGTQINELTEDQRDVFIEVASRLDDKPSLIAFVRSSPPTDGAAATLRKWQNGGPIVGRLNRQSIRDDRGSGPPEGQRYNHSRS